MAIAVFGSELLPSISPPEAVTIGIAIFLAGGLVQERMARTAHQAYVHKRLEMLQKAYDDLVDQVNRLARQKGRTPSGPDRLAGQTAGTEARSEKRVDDVVAEVKVLQDLIQRLVAKQGVAKQGVAKQGTAGTNAALGDGSNDVGRTREPTPAQDHEDLADPVESFGNVPEIDPAGEGVIPDQLLPEKMRPENLAARRFLTPVTGKAPASEEPSALQDPQEDPAPLLAEETQAAPKASPSAPDTTAGPAAEPEPSPLPSAEIHQLRPYPKTLSDHEILTVAREALRDDRVELALQPIVSLPQRQKKFYECFSRLRTKDGFMVSPDHYIELAEREGLVTAIDNMLLFRCFQLIRKLQRKGESFDFFCNLSSHTLSDETFFADFAEFLAGNGGLAKNLVFEFAQAEYENWNLSSAEQLDRLAKLGCRFSLDRVQHWNFDPAALASSGVHFVKVNPAMITQLGSDASAVLKDLRDHGIDLIVEKIESEETLVQLMDFDVAYAQGFLFGEPQMARPAA